MHHNLPKTVLKDNSIKKNSIQVSAPTNKQKQSQSQNQEPKTNQNQNGESKTNRNQNSEAKSSRNQNGETPTEETKAAANEYREIVKIRVHRGPKRHRSKGAGFITRKGGQILSYTADDKVDYKIGDCVYLENIRTDQPYYICSIKDFKLTKRDTLAVTIKWYFRASEVPDSVYQLLVQDRYNENSSGRESVVHDPLIRSRELFISNASDTASVAKLRGKCKVTHHEDIFKARDFQPVDDNYFYILEYNPKTKRLATTQGEIRVGSSHQAKLPELRKDVRPSEMPEKMADLEELKWRPKSVLDGDLMMYLRAARSVAAFAGMCDGGSTEDGCQAASMDETTVNAMDTLHLYHYDTGKALQALVKSPAMRSIEKKWTDEDLKRFVKGLRQYGKNFFKIRKELLPHKETGELVEFYYYWKKTPSAAANRPHRRHRRPAFKRNTRSQRPASEDNVDVSSASECSEDSDDSTASRELTGYSCRHCFTTVSKDWHHAGKDKGLRCTECRLFFKRHGEERPLDSPKETSPFLFKPVKEEESVNGKQNMRTRQNREPGKEKKKERISTDSPDIADSPLLTNQKPTGRKSPSSGSTCSNSSTDTKTKPKKNADNPVKGQKRQLNSDTEDKLSKKKKSEDSDSGSDSSSLSGNEENGNEGDIENNQDDLSSSSQPSTPRSVVETTDFKATAATKPPTVTQEVVPEVDAKVKVEPQSQVQSEKPASPPTQQKQQQDQQQQPHLHSKTPPPPPVTQHLPSSHTPSTPHNFIPHSLPRDFIPVSQHLSSLNRVPPLSVVSSSSLSSPAVTYSSPLSSLTSLSTNLSSQPPLAPESHHHHEKSDTMSRSVLDPPPGLPSRYPDSADSRLLADSRSLSESRSLLDPKRPFSDSYPQTAISHLTSFSNNFIKQEPMSPPKSPKTDFQFSQEDKTDVKVPPDVCNKTNSDNSVIQKSNQSQLNNPLSAVSAAAASVGKQDSSLVDTKLTSVSDSFKKGPVPSEFKSLPPQPGSLMDVKPSVPLLISDSKPSLSLEIKTEPLSSLSDYNRMSTSSSSSLVSPAVCVSDKIDSNIKLERTECVEIESEDDSNDRGGTLTPGPEPTRCNIQIHKSKSAIFMKVLNRGENNSCCRSDLIFKPLPDSKLAQKRPVPGTTPSSVPQRGPSSTTPVKTEDKVAKKPDTPPPNSTADAQITSAIASVPHSHFDRHPPRSYPDTPALRQLSEYAKPHVMGQEPGQGNLYGGLPPHLADPFLNYRLGSIYPPGSRERLELELERDKRERDAREREIREHEIRQMEMREKLKAELEMKPPGLERLMPHGANPLDPHWLDLQRRFGYPPTGGPGALVPSSPGASGSSHIPGVYPPTSLASDLMQRERERLERLGIPPVHFIPSAEMMYTSAVERLNAERLHAERMALAGDPVARLQMRNLGEFGHTHTHSHSHTHLHLHQPDQPTPLHPLGPPHLLPPQPAGADPMAGSSNPNGTTPGVGGPHLALAAGMPPHPLLASREQEILQNDLYRRACADPALAHQLSAQAAHHEALQRQMALERERYGPGHLPH